MELAYPTRCGVPIHPGELALAPSRLDAERTEHKNNHHHAFTRVMFGRFLLLKTFGDLAANQSGMMIDTHKDLHKKYGPPDYPTPEQALDFISDEYETDGLLRYGSQNHPTFKPITRDLMILLNHEYNELGDV